MIRTAPSLRPIPWAALALIGLAALATPAQAARNPRTANTAPVISGTPATTATTGVSYTFQPTAFDADGNQLSFRIKNKPAWASFSSSTGRLSGTPTVVQAYNSISIRVSDGRTAVSLPSFSIKATAPVVVVNHAPTITGTAPPNVLVGTGYYFKPTGYDADGDVLAYTIVNKPVWAVFDAGTGVLSGTPTVAQAYTSISIRVSDGNFVVALPTFSIQATAPVVVNRAPTITGTAPPSVLVGASYYFKPTGYDADGDVLAYTIVNKPLWAVFDAGTGALSGTPTVAQAYTSISIRVSDGNVVVALPTFSIQATAPVVVNHAPTITGTAPPSVLAGTSYYFKPTGYDADGDVLIYAIVNKPLWAVFDAGTGVVSGTPPLTATGTTGNISIGVSDGKANAALAAFSITVTAPANHAPTLSGVPVTSGEVGRPYAFKVTAADADGDPITFAIQAKPTWATFDTTGTLYGTPLAGNVGTYSGIIITASDGRLTTALAPFSIAVGAAPTKTVTLNWTAPSMNVDGTALTDLAGYVVSYGTATHAYTTTINIVGAGSNSVVIEGIEPGTWYFAMKSVNVPGVQSDYTSEVVAVL